MILKTIKIQNFRSYYGVNEFALSKGLTLIIGGNGDGKTTFFEALEWLFDTTIENKKESHISEKRKSELEIGESDELSVSITFEHDGEKELIKKFVFEKTVGDKLFIRDYSFIGFENVGSERRSINGKMMLENCFDSVIRKYCMFKGESELNVFDDGKEALRTLVETFSGIKQFDTLVEYTENFEQKSLNVVNQELKNDKKTSVRAKELDAQLLTVNRNIQDCKNDLKNQESAISSYSEKLRLLEENQETSELYQSIQERLKALSEKRTKLTALSSCDYNSSLLDEYWILRAFPSIIDEYQAKISAFSKEKRKLDKLENERRAKAKGAEEALKKLSDTVNSFVPLPWNLPDEKTMQEMIDDEVCKVCGRPAPKGSEAYEFMVRKLNEYLAHAQQQASISTTEDKKETPLFVNSYIDELHNRQIRLSGDTEAWISSISTEIIDKLDLINARKSELEKVKKDIQDVEDERTRILVQNPNLTPEILDKDFKDLKGYFAAKGRAETRVVELKSKLEQFEREKENIQSEISKLEPTNTMTQVAQRVHTALEQIMKSFKRAKDRNVTEFLSMLEDESNNYLKQLNENDFYGIIRIVKTIEDSATINLYSENGSLITNPGGAMKTTMYMSVLFAISKITTLRREQDYPLIFDAPTSSFEDAKENVFYNVIDKIDKQCIIVTKDLLKTNENTGAKELDDEKIRQLTCSVYRIKKAPNYNEKDLSTINTIVELIKE